MILNLYERLRELNINIRTKDGRLDIQAPKGVVSKELLEEIRNNKDELISFINSYKEKKEHFVAIPPAEIREGYALSSSQYRLWVLSQMDGGRVAYNMPGAYILEGELNLPALEQAFKDLISRHEGLRTYFRENDQGEVKQH